MHSLPAQFGFVITQVNGDIHTNENAQKTYGKNVINFLYYCT